MSSADFLTCSPRLIYSAKYLSITLQDLATCVTFLRGIPATNHLARFEKKKKHPTRILRYYHAKAEGIYLRASIVTGSILHLIENLVELAGSNTTAFPIL